MSVPAGPRYRLLLYDRLFAMLRGPALLNTIVCAGLWWFAPYVPLLATPLSQAAVLTIALVCGLLFLYAWIGPRLSYVQCLPNALRVSTPLYRLAISYSRIRTARPIQFVPTGLTWSQHRLVEPFIGRTVVFIDLTAYPMGERWLRLWFSEFMFAVDATGLILITEDWMTLSRDIDSHRSRWKTRRAKPAPKRPSTQRL